MSGIRENDKNEPTYHYFRDKLKMEEKLSFDKIVTEPLDEKVKKNCQCKEERYENSVRFEGHDVYILYCKSCGGIWEQEKHSEILPR